MYDPCLLDSASINIPLHMDPLEPPESLASQKTSPQADPAEASAQAAFSSQAAMLIEHHHQLNRLSAAMDEVLRHLRQQPSVIPIAPPPTEQQHRHHKLPPSRSAYGESPTRFTRKI